MSSTVHVKGISSQTSEKEVRDFFSFCGKIQSLSVTPETSGADASQSATVTFEKDTAAKTALLLDNTQLGPAQVHVTAAQSLDQIAGEKASGSDGEITQEDKPRARVAAEMLAHGYNLSDQVIQRALALDQQHGISSRFTSALQGVDQKYKVSEKTQNLDTQYGVSAKANQGWLGVQSYFDKALGTPTGQKLRAFYEQGQKQVLDVHNEAKHLAALKAGKHPAHPVEGDAKRTSCGCAANAKECGCAPGACACKDCSKNPETERVSAEKTGEKTEIVGGVEKKVCNCGGADSACSCAPGECACSGCPKA